MVQGLALKQLKSQQSLYIILVYVYTCVIHQFLDFSEGSATKNILRNKSILHLVLLIENLKLKRAGKSSKVIEGVNVRVGARH